MSSLFVPRCLALLVAGLIFSALLFPVTAETAPPFRPPSVPLVVNNPYLSIWSDSNLLTDDATKHWTGEKHPLVGLISIDGQVYRLMGSDPQSLPAFPQKSLQVTPTRSIYQFADAHVQVVLTFMTADLPGDLDVLTRPLSYLTWEVQSLDNHDHDVALYQSTSSLLAVNTPDQKVICARESMGPLTALKAGTEAQTTFRPKGDRVRIDWGYAYAAAPSADCVAAIGANDTLIAAFQQKGTLPVEDDQKFPRPANQDQPVLAFVLNLGKVGATSVARHLIIGYDEIYSIKFSSASLTPYWRRNGATPADLFQAAEKDYAELVEKCRKFDEELMTEMTSLGGEKYAALTALAYREAIAGTGIAADANKQPLVFTKENTSNGDIATVDVIFPMEPIFLFLSPTLAKAALVPVLDYAASPRWKFPNSPHDLGTYPVASASGDPGEAMVVEESGNMLILADAIMQADGDTEFVSPWWKQLTQWAEFLVQYGLDPEDQLCTDDFKGHLAHNANLSVKAIVALAAYGDMCDRRGDKDNAKKYRALAEADAKHWIEMDSEGDHFKLAFDKPGTWGQLYNLVWDRILGLNIFPPEVASKSIAYYKTKMNPYGLPLDSRDAGTKVDWTFWSATLADNPEDFQFFIAPIYKFFNQTGARNPEADQFDTKDVNSGGMNSRPVIGGLFIKMLSDPKIWAKWVQQQSVKAGPWAGFPVAPVATYFPDEPKDTPLNWRYTLQKPDDSWIKPDFDDSSWKEAPAGFGTVGPVHTEWKTDDIWIRRKFKVPAEEVDRYGLMVFHDEDFECYIDGTPAAQDVAWNTAPELYEIAPTAAALLRPGAEVTLAVHCHQTVNGQCIDVRVVKVSMEGK